MDRRERLHLALKNLSQLLECEVFETTFVGVIFDEPGRTPSKPRWVRAACVGDPQVDGSVRVIAAAKNGDALTAAVCAVAAGIRQERARGATSGATSREPAPAARPSPLVAGPVTARPGPPTRPNTPPRPMPPRPFGPGSA